MIDAASIFGRTPPPSIMVVGDVILDEYVFGEARRISQEAPVPIVEVSRQAFRPGGAANVAANIVALGGKPTLIGAVGDDANAVQLRLVLNEQGVDTEHLIRDPSRPTTCKTRVVAQNQQIVRLDRESDQPLEIQLEDLLLRSVEVAIRGMDVCILSDYGKGVVTPRIARHVIAACTAVNVPILVDPKSLDLHLCRNATLVKPNKHEAERLANRPIRDDHTFVAVGHQLAEAMNGSAILITRGSLGMTLFRHEASPFHLTPVARNVYDVTGAGDTVISTVAVALASGATLEQSAWLATRAAALAVDRLGTATVLVAELIAFCEQTSVHRGVPS